MNFDLNFEDIRNPLPAFTQTSAIEKVRIAEDAWNNKNPKKIATAYSLDSQWRNRDQFVKGRDEIIQFLSGKWNKELEYRLIKELWAYEGNRIAVRYAYEWHDKNGNWFRSHGNENWAFNEKGLMTERHASINDEAILESERKFHWPLGVRPADHAGLSEMGL
ncbi:nuclear transport factor 2 family protein [Pseudomonas sp. HK3]